MKVVSLILLVGTFVHRSHAKILGDFPGIADSPDVVQDSVVVNGQPQIANTTVTADACPSLNLNNIQGDILVGMKKLQEYFVFIGINNGASFKNKLKSTTFTNLVTTTAQLLDPTFSPPSMLNVAFSASGFKKMGLTGNAANVGDEQEFEAGMWSEAVTLGDDPNKWLPVFKNTNIHGVFLIASDSWDNISSRKAQLDTIFGSDYTVLYTLLGKSRPGNQAGHEHFGYMDGISQPALCGFQNPLPGQQVVQPGIILQGHDGDTAAGSRPSWAVDGAFLTFRQLQQLVPEFKKFLTDKAPLKAGMTAAQSAELFGARMIGRWPSGAPIDLTPLADDPVLGADPQRNNNFQYSHPAPFNITEDQSRCPFSAHIRKIKPRDDFLAVTKGPGNPNGNQDGTQHIMRAGIPYGPEVSANELSTHVTVQDRGLAFVAYSSIIQQGFRFQQTQWANNPNFVFAKNDSTPGFDPIIGQAGAGVSRDVSGLDINNFDHDISFPVQHVVSRGGEHFYSPSLAALKSGFV